MSQDLPKSEGERREQLLVALEKLLELPAAELDATLDQAGELIGNLLRADKVDIFLLEPSTQTLVARGKSDTPMVRQEKGLGLDRLQLANRGRIVEVFETGRSLHSGHLDEDPEELPGLKFGLGIRSVIAAPIEVSGGRRGVLECSSAAVEFFSPDDLRFLEAVARWVGVLTHRSELVAELTRSAAEQGRRRAADELITVLAHDMSNHLVSLRMRVELLHRRAVRQQVADGIRDAEAAVVKGSGSSGLGLGLYLARRIAVAHGGTLEVHSSPAKGARFDLALPLDPESRGP